MGETHNGFELSQHSVPPEEIVSGGPPPDGIPALINPNFISANEATYLQDHDRILGLQGKLEPKAYPIKILNWHEIANDSLEERPIVITYCPLCGSGIGFEGWDPHSIFHGFLVCLGAAFHPETLVFSPD